MIRIAKTAMPDNKNNKILFGDRKVFLKIETNNSLEYIIEQQVFNYVKRF